MRTGHTWYTDAQQQARHSNNGSQPRLTSSRQGSAELAVCTKSASCTAMACGAGATGNA